MGWMGTAIRRLTAMAMEHRWVFLVPVVTLMVPAAIYAVRLPDEWQASAQLQVSSFERGRSGRSLPGQRSEQVHQTVANTRGRLLARESIEAMVPVLFPDADAQDLEVIAKAPSSRRVRPEDRLLLRGRDHRRGSARRLRRDEHAHPGLPRGRARRPSPRGREQAGLLPGEGQGGRDDAARGDRGRA